MIPIILIFFSELSLTVTFFIKNYKFPGGTNDYILKGCDKKVFVVD